ncbi:hypothetical protein NC652_001960 [Populus alba x Populus x berolinensis]|nr:hypothetical protein NC652_001960 [Populus alba x Populus x berolinensis]
MFTRESLLMVRWLQLSSLNLGVDRGSVNFGPRLRLLAVSIIDILFHYLVTASLEPKECLFMSLYPTTPWNFIYMVADFGLAKHSLDTETHVSTRVMGTFGYMAPEYASSGKLTAKSDVYSFGVVLLELISGRRPVDRTQSFIDDSIVDWARPLLKQALEDGNFDAVVDPKLQDYDSNEMIRMICCAAACVRHLGRFRPRMSQIVRALEGNLPLGELNEGITPGLSMVYSSASSDYTNRQYEEDMKKFRKLALESPEHDSRVNPLASTSSQECTEPTSESGRNPFLSSTEGQQTKPEMDSPRKEENIKDN